MVDYVLRTSSEKHQVITIIYQGSDKITKRDIKVIDMKENTVEAYCYLRHQIRQFKKDNILSAVLKE